MNEESKLAYQFGLEVAKQLITLSTAIIGVTVTFTKDVFKETPSVPARLLLFASWVCYLASMWFGIGHIQSLTGSLEWASIERTAVSDSAGNLRARSWAVAYLGATTPDTVQASARMRLAETGVIIGDSAKSDARWQIRLFFAGTLLGVAYGVIHLSTKQKPVPASTANPD